MKSTRAGCSELGSAAPGERAALFWKLTDDLVRHEVAEVVVVYPPIRTETTGSP
jgi:hypothetical protein